MRILLDENMPLDFGQLLPGHQTEHVETIGLKGIKNGELLKVARARYDAFLTLDKGIPHQHSHAGHKLIVAVIRTPSANPDDVRSRSEGLLSRLENCEPGAVFEIPFEE